MAPNAKRRVDDENIDLSDIPEVDFSKAKVLGRGLKRGKARYTLRILREAAGVTQVEIAKRAEMSQGDISKLEGRGDWRVSTLERYARALKGKLKIVVEIGGREYQIKPPEAEQ